MAFIDTHVVTHRSSALHCTLGMAHRSNDRLKAKADTAKIEYRGYVSARGRVMLDVVINGERRYRLGPFENKQQRLVLLQSLRSAAASSTIWR